MPSVALALALLVTSCATPPEEPIPDAPNSVRVEEPRPRFVSRTGIPFLMDLPVIGFLFRRTTVVR